MCWRSHQRPSHESPGNIRALRARFCLLKTVRSFVPFLSLAEVVFSFEMEPFTVVLHEIGGVEIVPEGGLFFVSFEFRYFQAAHLLSNLLMRTSSTNCLIPIAFFLNQHAPQDFT